MLVDSDASRAGLAPRIGARRKRMLLIGPYFRPCYYGGAVQLYHQMLVRLKSFEGVVVSQRQGSDSRVVEPFDRTCASENGYDIRRIGRFDLIFGANASIADRTLDAARFFIHTRAEWRQVVRELQPDIVVCGATLLAGWLRQATPASIRWVNYLHGEELADPSRGSRIIGRYLRRKQLHAIRTADGNISVSGYTADRASILAGIRRDSITVLPNFVDLKRFSPPVDREALRLQLGWAGKRIILTLARLIPRKGVDQAIRALAELRSEGKLSPEWVHVIAGTGDQETKLRALVSELGVNEHTRFMGFVPQEVVPQYYGAADMFLHPNRDIAGDTEGFGIVFLEASACGVPVVGGVAGGTSDAIREGITGFRVEAENIPAIAGAVLRLIENEGLRSAMGRAGIDTVRREHGVDTAVARFEDLLQAIT